MVEGGGFYQFREGIESLSLVFGLFLDSACLIRLPIILILRSINHIYPAKICSILGLMAQVIHFKVD